MSTRMVRKPWFIGVSVGLIGIAWLVGSWIWSTHVPYSEPKARKFATIAFQEACISQKIDCSQFDGPFPAATAPPTLAYRWVLRSDPAIDIYVLVNRWMGAELALDPEMEKIPRVGAPPFLKAEDVPRG